jgi:hypothetical protein
MTQKAIPGLLRIMFLPRAGGIVMPGFVYEKWEDVLEAMENTSNSDEGVLGEIVRNDAVIWLFTVLLPVTPDSMGFSAPAWVRRGVIQPGLRGTELTPGTFAPTLSEVVSTVGRGTALGQVRSTLEGIQGVEDAVQTNENISDFIQTQAQQIQLKALELRQP